MGIATVADRLLTRDEAARLLSLSTKTLACWRSAGRGPVPVKFGNGRSAAVRYRESEVRQFMADPIAYDREHRGQRMPRFAPPPSQKPRRRKPRA